MDNYDITFQSWDRVAQAYQDRFMDLDLYNDTYDRFCSLLPERSAVFEIGCGPGNITRYLLTRRPDLSIDAIDVSPAMVSLARTNNPSVHFEVRDCRDLSGISKQYQGVICGFCLPYLSEQDGIRLIVDAGRLLVDGGVFYLSFLEGKEQKHGFETGSDPEAKMYVYYHSLPWVMEELEAAGFGQIEQFQKPYTRASGLKETHTILIARKN